MGAAGKGGEPLYVHAEQPRDGLGLGVAELRELLRHPPDRTVSLAQLHAMKSARSDGTSRCREAVLGHRLDEDVGSSGDIVPRVGEAPRIPAREASDAFAREGGDGVGASVLVEVAHGLGGELVVGAREGPVTPLRHDIGSGRTAATPDVARGMRAGRFVLRHSTVVGQSVEVPPDRRRGQPQPSPDLRCRDRTVLGNGGQHALAGALLVRPDKHHTIVT